MELFRIELEGEEWDEHVMISKCSRKTGRPKLLKINTQSIYSGLHHSIRAKISKEIKKRLYIKMVGLSKIEEYPISIHIIVYYPIGHWDLGNKLYLWRKYFEDALSGNVDYYQSDPLPGKKRKILTPMRDVYPEKIENDSVKYINKYSEEFIPVKSLIDRKIVFIVSNNK